MNEFLNLFKDIDGDYFVKILAKIEGHISSVRTVATLYSANNIRESITNKSVANQSKPDSFLLFSAGGRAQIKCWRLNFHQSHHTNALDSLTLSSEDKMTGLSVEKHHSLNCTYELLTTHMLAYKGRKSRKPWKSADYDASPETRYMDLSVFRWSDCSVGSCHQVCFVAAACSDGYVR